MTDALLVAGYNKTMHTIIDSARAAGAIDEHRERIIEQLQTGFAEDRYEVDELERRLTIANAADSTHALDALVTDLAAPRMSTALVPLKKMRVVFGSIERQGVWDLPQRLATRVVCGNLELDLREARFTSSEIEVNVTMGNVEIIVPPGVSVEMDASSFLGNAEDHSEAGATTRVIRVVGKVTLGNLEIRTMKVGETRWESHRRRKWERRARRRAMKFAHRCGRYLGP